MKMLKFYADWCGPCKMLSKVMEGMELPIEVQNVNIDEDMETTQKYGVRGVPTCIIVDGEGNVVREKVGVMNADQVTEFMETNV